MYICIAGKNKCAVDAIKYLLLNKFKKHEILVLPNKSDKGRDGWQPSLRKFANKKKIKIVGIKDLYFIRDLFFFSLEFEEIINVSKFKSKNLFNFHFSLLPKYRGCHTNFYQILNGEKYSGVSLHKIDKGIDTGDILDQIKFKIRINDTAFENYIRLMKHSNILFNKNLNVILKGKYKLKKQILKKGSYYSKDSVNYKKLLNIIMFNSSLKMHNKIRSLIFPAYQYPIVNGNKVFKSVFKNKKIYLTQ
tara:strand:+ start:4144 stop:4887 length:744 start_codon:yes stop_codon:yes gene_type:complete